MEVKREMIKQALPVRISPETAAKINAIIAANPEKRYTKIQVMALAVDMLAKKFLPKSTDSGKCAEVLR